MERSKVEPVSGENSEAAGEEVLAGHSVRELNERIDRITDIIHLSMRRNKPIQRTHKLMDRRFRYILRRYELASGIELPSDP
jgi:hypothetical protein